MKKLLSTILFCSAVLGLNAQSNTSKTYTLADWNLKNWDAQSGVLTLDVSEYKLDFNHPLPYVDMQAEWRVKADLKCGTLGTEQVFVCKEGKASHLIGRNSPMANFTSTLRSTVRTSANIPSTWR